MRARRSQKQQCSALVHNFTLGNVKKKGFCNNNGDYAHAPADGQTVKDRLNKSENNQAVILLTRCTFSKDCTEQRVGGESLKGNATKTIGPRKHT